MIGEETLLTVSIWQIVLYTSSLEPAYDCQVQSEN